MGANLDKLDVTIVNSVTLGSIWGVTDRRVRQLKDEGVISEVTRGKYDLAECTRRYCNFLRQAADANANQKEIKLNYDQEHALHEKIKREKAELQLQVMKGELHRSEDVELVMTDMLTRVKTKLLGLPSKMAQMVAGMKDSVKIQGLLQRQVEEALNELSDYQPDLFINDSVVSGDDDD